MANKGNFNFEKGGNKPNPDKGANGKINLDKNNSDELVNGIEVDEYGNPVGPVRTPQPEDPASVLEPDLSEESVKDAIENGPEEPKKKGFAWLWAIIGIAVVLGFLGMVFLKKGEKSEEPAKAEETETVAPAVDSTIAQDSAVMPAENVEASENSESQNVAPETSATSNSAASETAQTSAASSNVPAAVSGEIETESLKAIRGDYGNGNARREQLGSRYSEIQSRVNEMKRAGKF
ncbi:MAG: hypothetical protein K2H76_09275 [Muribaculaceae bacterium]|nr:hypothetical protein [Muribaculaceae bacterium]